MHHAHIDKFAYQDSVIHRLDGRVKFLAVLMFTVFVISQSRTSPAVLACFAVWPFAILVLAGIPLLFVFKHILLVSPFVLVLALTSPFYDRTAVDIVFGPFRWESTIGWLRCYVIFGKFVVTMMALIALVSTTRFNSLLAGLQKLYFPKILVIQLGLIYRYIFILIDRAQHILYARAARRLRRLGFRRELRIVGSMLGSLFVRSLDSAEHINVAMHARGFDGSWRTISEMKFRCQDMVFAVVSGGFMLIIHFYIGPVLL